MLDWFVTILNNTLGSVIATVVVIFCSWILKKVLSKTLGWRWVVASTVASFILIGGALWVYQQVNPNEDSDPVAPSVYRDTASTPPINSDSSTPSKRNPENRRPIPMDTPTPTPIPTLVSSPSAPTLVLSPTIRPDSAVLSVVIDRNLRLTEPLQVQVLSTLITGVDGILIEIHNAVCHNTEHINTKEWIQLHCGYYEETLRQTAYVAAGPGQFSVHPVDLLL